MRTLACALALMLTGLFAGNAAAVECSKKIATFDLVPDDTGRVIIALTIAGKPVRLGLDFTDYDSALKQGVASALGMDGQKTNLEYRVTQEGESVSQFVQINGAVIGQTPRNFTALLLSDENQTLVGIDGWLGLNFLAYFDVDMDFGGHKLNFFTPNRCSDKDIVYWTSHFTNLLMVVRKLGNFDFPVTVGGAPMHFGIGNLRRNLVRQSFATQVAASTQMMPGTPPMPPGTFDAQSYQPRDLKIGDVVIANPPFGVIDDVTQPQCQLRFRCFGHEAAGYVSMKQLQALHIYISYMEKAIFVSAADAK